MPIPDMIDLYFLKEEVEARKDLTALEAVMSVDEEREKLEKQVENLNTALASLGDKVADGEDEPTMNGENANMSVEEQQETIMELLSTIYERLDALDASTAETRARSILKGLGFTHAMQVCDFIFVACFVRDTYSSPSTPILFCCMTVQSHG